MIAGRCSSLFGPHESPERRLDLLASFFGTFLSQLQSPTLAFLIGGMVLTYFYPITKAAHAETLLQLAERRRQTK